MKKFILLFIIPFLFFGGCANIQKKKMVEELVEKGTTKDPIMYYDGKLYSGIAVYVDDDGVPWKEEGYKEGKLHGKTQIYFDDGVGKKIEKVRFYKNGQKHGPFKTFFYNGNVSQERFWKNNERVGIWTAYDESGQVLYTKDFQ